MLFPLVVAFVAVFLGAWLALGPREGAAVVRPIRLIAIAAAAVVIAVHLLPEAYHELGFWAVLGFAAGLAVPTVTERVGALFSKRSGGGKDGGAVAGLEIAYAGLVVHRFGDGLSMGAYSRTEHGAWAQAEVVLALAAHIVPVTTVMMLALVAVRGRRAALVRAALLAASTMAGVVVAGVVVAGGPRELSPWISAVVAGLLLHIVVHDMPGVPGRHSRRA
jgi:zinc transporter ZupT